jgi:U3 small nucleolar RNA-associated protein MPP10
MGRGRRPSKAKPKTKAKKLEDDVEESGSAAEDNSIAVAAEPGEGAEELGLGGKAATLTNLVSEPQHCLAGLGGGEQAEQERVKILRGLLKWFFEYSRAADEASGAGDDLLSSPIGPLDELMVDDFDLDSIWAQLQLRNGAWVKQINKAASLLVASSDVSLAADISSSSEGEEEDGPEDDGSELEPEASLDDLESEDPEEFDGELEEEDSRFATIKGDKKKKKKKETVKGTNDSVRDGFFDLSDMNRFADEEEAMNDELSEQELDFIYGGGDVLSDDEGREATFDDFFKRKDYAPRRTDREEDDDGDGEEDEEEEDDDETDEEQENDELNGAREGSDLEEEESEEDGDGNPKSQFARKQQQLKKAIKGMEDELIREKPWALRGEVAAKDRPTNSLLEAALDVERVARVVQPVTAEKSASLEELIKQRILDEKFDDLVPKNVELPHNKKKQSAPEVSQEKSSEGLGDIYAAEYMRRTLGVEKDDPKKPLKEELKVLFSKLCHKLVRCSLLAFAASRAK